MIHELDYLLTLGQSGVEQFAGGEAEVNQVKEWLATPNGAVYGMPSFGHDLKEFLHQPNSSSVDEVEAEIIIVNGLNRDLPHLSIHSISVRPHKIEPDKSMVRIVLNGHDDEVEAIL